MSAARMGLVALFLLAAAYGTLVQQVGCSQSGHLVLTRSLADGTPHIDELHWFTCDKSYNDGHFHAAKSPGLALVSAPLFAGLQGIGVAWDASPPYSDSTSLWTIPFRAVWPLTLWAVVLPALLLLLLVRRAADEVEAGYGTVAALTLGAGTLVLPYSSVYASHVPAALLAFCAYVLAARARRGGSPLLAAAAGVAAGLAIVLDAPLALAAIAIGAYAVLGARPLARAAGYAAGAVAGALPLLLFNWWALGSPFRSAYENVVTSQGLSGRDVLGAQNSGLFGITTPRLDDAAELLLAPKGLVVLTPLVAVSVAGLVLLWRRGLRAEVILVSVLAAGYLTYNAGYFQPFGGGSAGARFLLPAVVFLSLPLAAAYRRWPLTTGALALVSAAWAVAATVTLPLLEGQGTGEWLDRLGDGRFMQTVVTLLGGGQRWLAIVPFALLLAGAVVAAVRATPAPQLRVADARAGVAALLGWAAVYAWSSRLVEPGALELAAATVVAAGAIAAVLMAYRSERLTSWAARSDPGVAIRAPGS